MLPLTKKVRHARPLTQNVRHITLIHDNIIQQHQAHARWLPTLTNDTNRTIIKR